MSYGNNYGPAAYDARMDEQCEAVPSQEPFTNQLNHRLIESEKRIADMTMTASRIAERLFGPNPMISKMGLGEEKIRDVNVPIQRSIIDQLMVQTNMVNRRLGELSEVLRRLEAL